MDFLCQYSLAITAVYAFQKLLKQEKGQETDRKLALVGGLAPLEVGTVGTLRFAEVCLVEKS